MASQAQDQAPVPEVIAAEMAKDRQLRREERQALTAIPAADLAVSPLRTTFMPQSMGEAMQLATIMARSTFVPQHCRGNEGNCLAIIMQAGRWGMDPFAVANKAYFTRDGAPPAFEAQLVNAVVNSSGALSGRLRPEFTGEGEALRCTVRGFLRADPNDEKVKTQSLARITVRNSPLWKSDPEQQLGYYTTRAWARMHCPEVLLGVFTPDEMEIEPERARVVSPQLPRRSDRQVVEEEDYDAEIGEVIQRDASGMTIVSEDVARELDAGQGEGPAEEQRGEPEPNADYRGDATPQNAASGQTWYKPADGKLRFAHETPNGIKWYMAPQKDDAPAEKPEPSLADDLRQRIARAGDLATLSEAQELFGESKSELSEADIKDIRERLAERRNDLA